MRRGWFLPVSRALTVVLAMPGSALAAGDAETSNPRSVEESRAEEQGPDRESKPDFLFGAPRRSIAFRGGWAFAGADSEVFDFVGDRLTIEDSDFNAPALGIDLEFRVRPRLAVQFRFEYSTSTVESEFRDYVDQDDQPITQETKFLRIPLTGSLKVYLTSRGREVGRYAWIPNGVAPYVGGGGGFLWYEFDQFGDFVDFADLSIFTDTFISEGWTPTFHVFGGAHVKLSARAFLVLEVCYAWADADLGRDFVGFDPIDLSGLTTIAAVELVF